ncbi:2-nitropropane dioxygenase [Ornithinimicrobium avium]|uniref:2-nitropropane dioxygenase n=1 Tax=Ornithinimicrobium avium TaxID=2283195 RepID=A0A345NPC1_9MICO|nr:2-nitropropane dioxygenase [Ornithinimicrobium avium]AXH96879.1 2-nitropropane dioxygenase [Ornithinimicrobium avium]
MRTQGEARVELTARIELCHAALQHLADRVGADVLHVKGLAFEPQWRSRGAGTDADLLVRPSHVRRLVGALDQAAWHRRSRFHTGSPFGHAQTYWHDHLGYADVHRFFPGMSADEATFDVLWADREVVTLGGVPNPVPSQAGQALVFLLNETRNGATADDQPRLAALRDSAMGAQVRALVPRVGAEVAHAAALGELDRVRDRREHDLWRAITTGSGRVEEWRARVKAQPTLVGKVATALRAPLVNTEHLANTRGHDPSPVEVAVEFVDRGRRGLLELWAARGAGRDAGGDG